MSGSDTASPRAAERPLSRSASGLLSGLTASGKPPYTLVDVQSPPLRVTVAREAILPARVGVRKDWHPLGLLKMTAKADVELRTGNIVYGFSLKDRLLGGRFSANIPDRLVEYRKKLPLPNGAVVVINAACQYDDSQGPGAPLKDRLRPMLGVQMVLGEVGSGNAVWSGKGFDVKQRIPTPLLDYPKLEFELYGSVAVPMLTARYSVQQQRPGGGSSGSSGRPAPGRWGSGVGSEGKPLHIHLAQTNIVFRF